MPKQPKKGAKIACIVTGDVKYIAECFLAKKIAKYGSLENYRRYYVSNFAKRELRSGKTVQEVRKDFDKGHDLPDVDIEVLLKLKLIKKKKRAEVVQQQVKEELKKTQEVINRRKAEERDEIKTYGAFGAWVRHNTASIDGRMTTCIRPDIYLNNDEHCGNCECFEHCLCRLRNARTRA